jgi:predicted dehydrogenase
MKKIRWGILSTAKIGREKVIPALQKSQFCRVDAICSRNLDQAKKTAALLNIEKAYGSYEELLNDPDIDAVYIPLPNHLHVEWSIKAMAAGKHVLCEKPIGLTASDATKLLKAVQENPGLKVMEAFMYRYHPQWIYTKKLVDEQKIGELKMVQSFFTYYNVDPANIRNRMEVGGGAMMDIGCYCVSLSRFLFGEEPESVFGVVDRDPEMHTDRMSSGILNFPKGVASFTCSTQLMPHQRVNIMGTKGRIEIEIPFNMPPDQKARVWLFTPEGNEEVWFDAVDQYTLQADQFVKAIHDDGPVPFGIEDAVNNMKVIEAIFESAAKNYATKIPRLSDTYPLTGN